MRFTALRLGSLGACAVLLVAGEAAAQSDWDAYMLSLINRARVDPTAENAIQGTSYTNPAVGPLAYNLLIGDAAADHNLLRI